MKIYKYAICFLFLISCSSKNTNNFLILLFKYNYHQILPIQVLTLFLNIYIMYKEQRYNHNLSNIFVYLQWLNYIIEFLNRKYGQNFY